MPRLAISDNTHGSGFPLRIGIKRFTAEIAEDAEELRMENEPSYS